MRRSSRAKDSIAVELGSIVVPSGTTRKEIDDQLFLLYFIMGTYFGPDLLGEWPEKSVLQRMAEGLLPYTPDQLAGSHMKTVEIQDIYYHVLRNADKSVVAKSSLFNQFFQGNLPNVGPGLTTGYPQFPDLFPLQMHRHSRFNDRDNFIENIVLIKNPVTYFIKQGDIRRFKRLTGIQNFCLDEDFVTLHGSRVEKPIQSVAAQEEESNGEFHSIELSDSSQRMRHMNDLLQSERPMQMLLLNSSTEFNRRPIKSIHLDPSPNFQSTTVQNLGPTIVFLPSGPSEEECNNILAATKTGFALTGTAAMGQVRPLIGLLDIGECEDTYFFRMSLPGVKRNDREFSCEVDTDGKVLIRGVTTTGERTVTRYSQVFEMQTQNLCPPGLFSISFQLPGPVKNQRFSGNFGIDGILEGIVMKGGKRGYHQN